MKKVNLKWNPFLACEVTPEKTEIPLRRKTKSIL